MKKLLYIFFGTIFWFLFVPNTYAQTCPPNLPLPSNPEQGNSYSIEVKVCKNGDHLLHIRDVNNNLERTIQLNCQNFNCPATISFPNEGQKKVYLLFASNVEAQADTNVTSSTSTFVPTCNYQETREDPIPTCNNDTNPTNGPCCPSTCTSAPLGGGVQRCGASTTCVSAGQTCTVSGSSPCCIPLLCKASDPAQGPINYFCQSPPTHTPVPPKAAPNLTPPCAGGQCNTALGPFRVDNVGQLISQIFVLGLAIGGAAAVLLIIYAGFILMTSAGDKERIQGARETLISAIAGLIFILLSFGILSFIAKNVLNIPGF